MITDYVKFVQPECWQVDEDFDEVVAFAKQMSCMCDFPNSQAISADSATT